MEYFEAHWFGLDFAHLPVIKTAFEDTLNQLIRLHMTSDSAAIESLLKTLTAETLNKLKRECDTVIFHNPHLANEYRAIQNTVIKFLEINFRN